MMPIANPKRAGLPLGLLALTGLAFWWSTQQGGHADNAEDALEKKRCVLVIGIDGLRSDALRVASTPQLDSISASGGVTYNAFAGGIRNTPTEQITSSGPGWASMLTGVWTDKHRVRDNSFGGNRLRQYPHFFKFIKEARPTAVVASFINWEEIGTKIVDPVGEYFDYRFPDGATLPATYVERDRLVLQKVEEYLSDQSPDAMFVYFGNVDIAGHSTGFSPSNLAYLSAIETVDEQVGKVLEAVRSRPDYSDEEWMIIVSTDHGGLGTTHGGQSNSERKIFLMASGAGIQPRVYPTGPGHTAVPPTAMRHLGIPVDSDWGWDSEAFGYPPYCPAELRATADHRFAEVSLKWSPPEGLDLASQEVLRDGELIATLPITASEFIDLQPLDQEPLQVTDVQYSLKVTGSDADLCETLTATATFYSGPVNLGRIVDSAFDGNLLDNEGTLPLLQEDGLVFSRDNDRQYLEITTSDELNLGRPTELNFGSSTDFSISFLVKMNSTSGPFGTLLGNRVVGSNPTRGWSIGFTREGKLQWEIADGQDGIQFRSQEPVVADGRWHSVTVTHDRKSIATIYVDGLEIGREDISSIDHIGTGQFRIGGRISAGIDDLHIWQRGLLPREVRGLFSIADVNSPPSYDAVVDLRFRDSTGEAIVTGDVIIEDAGIPGGAVALRNVSATTPAFLSLGNNADLEFGTDQDFTASVWVKTDGNFGQDGTKSDPAILSNKNWRNGASAGWAIAAGKDGRWQWNIGDGENSHRADFDSPAGTITDGEWHHIAVAHDRDQFARLYFDGTEIARRDISEVGDLNSGLPTAIGTDGMFGADWPAWFHGSIDNVQIWRRVLSAQEITFIFQHFALPLASPLQQLEIARERNYATLSFVQPTGGFGRTGIDYTVSGQRFQIEQSATLTGESWLPLSLLDFDIIDPTSTTSVPPNMSIKLKVPLVDHTANHFRLKVSPE